MVQSQSRISPRRGSSMTIEAVEQWAPIAGIKEAALRYAGLGIAVFPVHSVIDGTCTCGDTECRSPGKHPLSPPTVQNGLHSATTERVVIEQWWSRHPYANIGARPDSIGFVLDVDPRNGGDQSYHHLTQVYGDPDATLTAHTGSGGRHYWFRDGPIKKFSGQKGGPLAGLDFLSRGSYVIMPPSRHRSGDTYEWEAGCDLLAGEGLVHVTNCPPRWLELTREATEPGVGNANKTRIGSIKLMPGPADQVRRARQLLAQIDPDIGRDDWIKIGMALHASGWQESFDLWDGWSSHGQKYPGHSDLWRRWLNDFDYDGGLGIGTFFQLAQSLARTPAATLRNQENMSQSAVTNDRPFLIPLADATENIKKSEQLVEDFFEKRALGVLFGPSGSGKTFVALDLALSIAAGKQWAGRKTSQCPVVYLNGEGARGMSKRLKAWLLHHKLDGGDVPFFLTRHALPLTEGVETETLIEAVNQVNAELIVVDTLARNFLGNENDAAQMNAFINNLGHIQAETNAAILIIHHTNLETTERARGNNQLNGALDSEFRVIRDNDLIALTATKQKDMDGDISINFETECLTFRGADNQELSSLVVKVTDKNPYRKGVISGSVRELLSTISEMQNEVRVRLEKMGSAEAPRVSRRQLAERMPNLTPDTLRQQLSRLKNGNHIELNRHDVWLRPADDWGGD